MKELPLFSLSTVLVVGSFHLLVLGFFFLCFLLLLRPPFVLPPDGDDGVLRTPFSIIVPPFFSQVQKPCPIRGLLSFALFSIHSCVYRSAFTEALPKASHTGTET